MTNQTLGLTFAAAVAGADAALVDTDTVEQNIAEATPIDLFARIDLVKDAIEQRIPHSLAGDGGTDAAAIGDMASSSGGGCSVAAPGR